MQSSANPSEADRRDTLRRNIAEYHRLHYEVYGRGITTQEDVALAIATEEYERQLNPAGYIQP